MIETIVVAGLAGFWLWSVLNDGDGIAKPIWHLLARYGWTRKWMECPWCSGAWFAGAGSLILFHPSVAVAIVVAIAAAAVTGMLGSYFQGD